MTERERIEVDALFDILIQEGFNVDISKKEEMFKVYRLMFEGISANNEYEFVELGSGLRKEKCVKCIELQKEIDRLQNIINIHVDSIKKRRDCSEVWIDGKEVMYR